ncbi:RelA/SpoT family protein [Pseudobacteriovorax antillogorgiicola]|uniref:GTP pyrophosphokinase n=1 Tax=Pseudobacteriovorax antillogorgiicola TaxID=1513793 RepID=A0A1Y6BX69_9BACT|nr:bifunctional (p)ppGpp synthetase/guanosine-3',5'-bis(diphosphate) 3'-pyrophosphohydrolase [Pseudobacteriovorax antillogorgiicola]TCS50302.1 GTP pyrophosphokinase [Pseudobacteriovorax antillogorgiicola]SMF33998.1 GTP pyrophosphokinase [Pseudobacteriovorax antillogorgiicola]
MTEVSQSKVESKTVPVTPEQEFEALLDSLDTYLPGQDRSSVHKAYEFAAKCHSDQTRRSGEPYITHPLAVANIVTTLKLDTASVVAAILHDTVEDTSATIEDIEEAFGTEVAHLVDGLTKISKIKFRSKQEKLAENFRKMILAMAKDLRVIMVKLCDRLHNMRTIGSLQENKRRRISQETLDIYAPLANRLGIYGIKSELEDLCLRHLRYETYQTIRSKIAAKKSVREKYIAEVIEILETELRKYGFKEIQVYGRPKHFFSIYKKMVDRRLDFEDIHDLFAFRIIVDSIKDCYEALGVVHAMWKPMPGRFKDYIAMPKANMYQSLHTTVIRPNGEPAEIQIRTREMHETCEFGVAAHWAYKDKDNKQVGSTDMEKFSWLRQIVQWQSELKDPDEFLEAVKVDLFDEEIFVFTPKGDVFSLPKNATALDFAFSVHSDVGLKCIGVKINGRMAPIKKRLNSGDIVEVLTSPHQKPSKDWLNFIATSKARNKIRSFLRSEQRERSRKIGRDLLSQTLDKAGLSIEDLEKSGDTDKLVKAARESNFDDILIGVGYGRLNANQLIAKAFPPPEPKENIEEQLHRDNIETRAPQSQKRSSNKSPILVSGYDDVLVTLGRCCQPLPGEPIIGFITRGRGVTVHRSACPRALDLDPARKIQVEWGEKTEGNKSYHKCYISLRTQDKPGVLAEVTSVLSACNANVHKAEAKVSSDLTGVLEFELGVKNLEHLEVVVAKLENLKSVVSVRRKNIVKQRRLRRGRHS